VKIVELPCTKEWEYLKDEIDELQQTLRTKILETCAEA
jgi:hypothetical protein